MVNLKYLLKEAKSLHAQGLLIGYQILFKYSKIEQKNYYLLTFQNFNGHVGYLVEARTQNCRHFNSLDVLMNVVFSVGFDPLFLRSEKFDIHIYLNNEKPDSLI